MTLTEFLPALLSIALIGGGGAMVVEAARHRSRLLAARVALVAGAAPKARNGVKPEDADNALLRLSSTGLGEADLMQVARLCRKLGLPPRQGPMIFAAARLLFGALLAAGVLVLVDRVGASGPLSLAAGVAMGPVAVILGWLMPVQIIRGMVRRRVQAVSDGLPEALELLVVCAEAGLALEDGLDRITEELRRSQPMLAEELATTSADLKILPDRDQAFHNLAERIGTPGMRSVVTTLSQTLRYGTPLATALRTAAAELRNEMLLSLEERANRLPSLLTVPMMAFIMPTIFLVIGGPVALRVLDAWPGLLN